MLQAKANRDTAEEKAERANLLVKKAKKRINQLVNNFQIQISDIYIVNDGTLLQGCGQPWKLILGTNSKNDQKECCSSSFPTSYTRSSTRSED